MMGPRQVEQGALFYNFSIDAHVSADHLLRSIDRFVDLSELRRDLAPFYSSMGRPSSDPELMIRMLIVGYCFGIRSERRLCEEVHLNLACRWFCRLGLDGDVPDHSTFSKNRHGRFRKSDLLRRVFETVLLRCIEEGLVGGEGFAVDASLIKADANTPLFHPLTTTGIVVIKCSSLLCRLNQVAGKHSLIDQFGRLQWGFIAEHDLQKFQPINMPP